MFVCLCVYLPIAPTAPQNRGICMRFLWARWPSFVIRSPPYLTPWPAVNSALLNRSCDLSNYLFSFLHTSGVIDHHQLWKPHTNHMTFSSLQYDLTHILINTQRPPRLQRTNCASNCSNVGLILPQTIPAVLLNGILVRRIESFWKWKKGSQCERKLRIGRAKQKSNVPLF